MAGYRIDEQIGRGGMAVVYRARDLQLDRQVALKILAPVLAGNEQFRQRFLRESRAAAAVDHPNIIPVFAAGEADGVLFIAMRCVYGPDVRRRLDSGGPLAVRRAVDIVSQVAAALDTAHQEAPIGLTALPGGRRLLVANSGMRQGHPASLAVIDEAAALAGRPALVGVIGAGLLPREFAVVPGGRTALVTNSAAHQLEAVNVSQLG